MSDTLAVLLGLRLQGFGETADIARRTGLVDVGTDLCNLRSRGFVSRREGARPGWRLTGAGRVEGERLLKAELDERGARTVVTAVYKSFLELNTPLLRLCTDWQVYRVDDMEVVNDHSDEAYDAAVLDRLNEMCDTVTPLCATLTTALARFGGYERRFENARTRVEKGDTEWFTKPMIDSFHTVWFELHENLLATLNIERAKEGR